jgi:tetratricopeptide (TPR) repeat protein
MNYEKLDNEELLRLALDAMNGQRDADAVVMLKTLLERDPSNVHGQYLLAAQHAQMGLMDRAEAGFRQVVAHAPNLAMARFQLGQLLVLKGAADEASQTLAPLTAQENALGAFARGLIAIAQGEIPAGLAELAAGLALPQEIPALAADMRRLSERLQEEGSRSVTEAKTPATAPIFLTGYGRGV